MAHFCFSSFIVMSSLIVLSKAMIPSFGLETTGSIRAGLRDTDFRIRPSLGTQVETPTFRVSIADLTNFPALAGQDVQSTIVRVELKAGERFLTHFHPRGSETLNVLKGTFRVSFRFAGVGEVRNITNIIRTGESTVFPQGLVHTEECISTNDCVFLSVLGSADAGTVPVENWTSLLRYT